MHCAKHKVPIAIDSACPACVAESQHPRVKVTNGPEPLPRALAAQQIVPTVDGKPLAGVVSCRIVQESYGARPRLIIELQEFDVDVTCR